ncbi:MAG: oligosaccharide flippase family protein [Planctomycetia bacterium]|nr:oligosaccharide flippase family protein [Planctomycetia bacterium]
MFRKLLSLLSDVAVYGISSLLSQLIGFLLLPVYTRFLTPDDFGVIGMLSIVTLLFGPLANLGMTNAIFRRFSFEKDEKVRSQVLSTGLCSVAISSLLLLTVSFIFAEAISRLTVGNADATHLVRLSLLSAAATTIGVVPLSILRAGRRVKTTATVNVSKLLISVCCTIWLVVVLGKGVWGVVVGTLVGEVTMAVVQLAMTLRSFRSAANLATWKRMASYGLPFVPHHVQAVALGLFGQYMVREMLGLAETGLYLVAARFALPVSFVVNAVQNSWVAYKFQIHAEDRDAKSFFASTLTYYVAGLSYLWVGVSLWGPEMVRLMTAPNFHEASRLVWALTLIPVAQGIYYMAGTGLELSDNTRHYPLVSLAGLVTVVAGAFPWIRHMGALGAALDTALGWIVMGVAIYYFSQRRVAIAYDWLTIGCFALAAVMCVTLGGIVQNLPLLPRLACATGVSLAFPLVGFTFLLRSRDERHRMLYLLTKFRLATSNR